MPRRRGTSLETPRRLLGSAKILGLARMALNSAQDFVREGLGRPDVWQRVENDPARDLLHTTVYEYNLQGRKTYEGGGTYPVRFTYDDEGRMTSMIMYRDESGPGDTTAWTYDLRLTLRLRHFRFHHLLLPPLFHTVSSQRLPGCVY